MATGFDGAIANIVAGLINNIPLIVGTGALGEAARIGSGITRAFQVYGGIGLGRQAIDVAAWKADPLKQATELIFNAGMLFGPMAMARRGGAAKLRSGGKRQTPEWVMGRLNDRPDLTPEALAKQRKDLLGYGRRLQGYGKLEIHLVPRGSEHLPLNAGGNTIYENGVHHVYLDVNDLAENDNSLVHELGHIRAKDSTSWLYHNSGFYQSYREFMVEAPAALDVNKAFVHATNFGYLRARTVELLPVGGGVLAYVVVRNRKKRRPGP